MDELMNLQNTRKEIVSTCIAIGLWILGAVVFGFIHFDLMYLIINCLILVFTVVILIIYIRKYKAIQDKIAFYVSDKYEIKTSMDLLIVDYYKQVIDEKIEKELNSTCDSILNGSELTLEAEKKDYILFVKIVDGEVSYAVSALDEEFYTRTTKLYELTKHPILADEYFAKLDGKDTFKLTSLDEQEVYNTILEFMKNKMKECDELFEVYNENLKLLG